MHATKPMAVALLLALACIASWTAYRVSRQAFQPSSPAPASAAPSAPPLVEFREMHTGPHGDTGTLLTIDDTGLATLQTLPLGPGSKTTRIYLGCDEFAALPDEMRYPLDELHRVYGSEQATNRGEVSVVSRFGGRERRVLWRNPESSPRPPEGTWAGLVAPLEDIRREAEETPKPAAESTDQVVVEYGHLSSGAVGTYITELVVYGSGEVSLGHGLHGPWPVGVTQISREEVANLRRTIEDAQFMDFQRCYGQHAPVNPQNSWIMYRRNGAARLVTWMSSGSDPKPPDAWFRIVTVLEQIDARIEKQAKQKPAPSPHG
jgi:hypothetical protein